MKTTNQQLNEKLQVLAAEKEQILHESELLKQQLESQQEVRNAHIHAFEMHAFQVFHQPIFVVHAGEARTGHGVGGDASADLSASVHPLLLLGTGALSQVFAAPERRWRRPRGRDRRIAPERQRVARSARRATGHGADTRRLALETQVD